MDLFLNQIIKLPNSACIRTYVTINTLPCNVRTYTRTDSLSTDVKRTLRDYETTLRNQTAHIEDLKRENEVAVVETEELGQQCSDLELRVSRACAAKEALSSRVEELTNSLDGEHLV